MLVSKPTAVSCGGSTGVELSTLNPKAEGSNPAGTRRDPLALVQRECQQLEKKLAAVQKLYTSVIYECS